MTRHRHWRPYVSLARLTAETTRQHADNGQRYLIQADGLPEDVSGTAEVLLRQCVADECDRMSAWRAVFSVGENPPLRQLDSQKRQVTGGHEFSVDQRG